MPWCDKCGEPIVFRYIDGNCKPIHVTGSCSGFKSSGIVTGYSRSETNDICTHTKCPKCGNNVFFIKHNGGSVWIDSPLGPPWYKHPCFDQQASPNSKDSLASHYNIEVVAPASGESLNTILGLVGPSYNSYYDRTSFRRMQIIQLDTMGNEEFIEIKIKDFAEVILSKICVYDMRHRLIWPVSEPTHKLAVIE